MHWVMISCLDKSKTRVERPAVFRCHLLDTFVVADDVPDDSDHHDFLHCGCVVRLYVVIKAPNVNKGMQSPTWIKRLFST